MSHNEGRSAMAGVPVRTVARQLFWVIEGEDLEELGRSDEVPLDWYFNEYDGPIMCVNRAEADKERDNIAASNPDRSYVVVPATLTIALPATIEERAK